MYNLDTVCLLAITMSSCQTLHLGEAIFGNKAIAAVAGSLRYIKIIIVIYTCNIYTRF